MFEVVLVAALIGGMGVVALLNPKFVFTFFDTPAENPNIRNEIRAVYGGFGLAIAGLLLWGSQEPVLQTGIVLTVAVALLGMAAGRLLAAFVERPGKWPVLFFGMEVILGGMLLLTVI